MQIAAKYREFFDAEISSGQRVEPTGDAVVPKVSEGAWLRRNGIDQTVLEGLLPNQNGLLCSAQSLRRDIGVSEEIKDMASGWTAGCSIETWVNSLRIHT